MQLDLPEDTRPVKEMFERFFATEATPARVRASEPLGFDPALWRSLVELEAPFMRLDAAAGGAGMGLFDACVMLEEAGRRLAPAPLAEAMVALRILGQVGGDAATQWIEKARDGDTLLTLALHPTTSGKPQLVAGGAAAAGILTFDGSELAIETGGVAGDAPHTLGGVAAGLFTPGTGQRVVLSSNADVAAIWQAGIEEWKLLTSASLIGLSREALAMASAYAAEREAFGQPVGANQGLAHPLANDVIDADGAGLLLWWTLRAIADDRADAGAAIAMLFWWTTHVAGNAVAHALHAFGGYGLSDEYDIQLYHRRAKSLAQIAGDPRTQLTLAGRRLLLDEASVLPDTGPVEVDFEAPDKDHPLAGETRALFDSLLDPAKHMLFEDNFEAHDWEVYRTLGSKGLLFPDWPEKWGGRGQDAAATRASGAVWQDVGYASLAKGVSGMVGKIVQLFGQPAVHDEVLRRFASGEITASLGYTEPSCGSDVFAARTRAVRDGDDWVINGQKMFTSGAEHASYVLLLTRTNPDVAKHKGLTLFLVPLDSEGVEIHPVHTFMDERTNATFYSDVRVPDRYRIGEVDGGLKVMAAALTMEQGGAAYHHHMNAMIDAVADWARGEERDGRPLIEHDDVLARLARVYSDALVSQVLNARSLWRQISGGVDQAFGPAAKVFSTQAFIDDAADLVDLAAPGSLIRGKTGLGVVEKGYRHSTATSIYGGTSEVLRSMVAEKRLGLPRSRA